MPAPAPRLTLLSAGALAAALLLGGCSGDDATSSAPAPAKVLPSAVESLVTKTDVGQYFVTPKAGTSKEAIAGVVAKLKTMPGVQSSEQNADGMVDVQFRGGATAAQRAAAVKQLATLGEVTEGI